MKESIKEGLSFGLTSGVITTLGMIVGLNSGIGSKLAVLGGILIIAVADAFSDALGIHLAKESDKKSEQRHVWRATIATFISKFIVALTFTVPFLFFNLRNSIIVCIVWGLLLLSILSYSIAKSKSESPWKVIFEHVLIAVVVIIITNYVGQLIPRLFGSL